MQRKAYNTVYKHSGFQLFVVDFAHGHRREDKESNVVCVLN